MFPEVHTQTSANLRWRGVSSVVFPESPNTLTLRWVAQSTPPPQWPSLKVRYYPKHTERHKGLTLFSGEHRYKGLTHAPLCGILRGGNRSLAQSLGQTPQQLEAPTILPQRPHKGLGQSPQHLETPSKLLATKASLVCLFPRIFVESYTNAPNAMTRTSLSNSTKATKAIGGIREKEQRSPQRTPKSSSRDFPSQREEVDW